MNIIFLEPPGDQIALVRFENEIEPENDNLRSSASDKIVATALFFKADDAVLVQVDFCAWCVPEFIGAESFNKFLRFCAVKNKFEESIGLWVKRLCNHFEVNGKVPCNNAEFIEMELLFWLVNEYE